MATNFGKVELPVSFSPQTAFPLDSRCYFETKSAALAAAATAKEAGSSNSVYYFGQIIAVNEAEEAAWTLTTDPSITVPKYKLTFEDGAWTLSVSNGFVFSDFEMPLTPTSSATYLTAYIDKGNLTLPVDHSLTDDILVEFSRSSAVIDTWNLYIIDQSSEGNLKKIGSGGGGEPGDYVPMSAMVSAFEGGLGRANADNPFMLSSDLSDLVEKAIRFKGAVSALSEVQPPVDVGDMWIITGDTEDAGQEYVCTSLSGQPPEPVWSALGNEGTMQTLMQMATQLSTVDMPDLSNGLTSVISSTSAYLEEQIEQLSDSHVSVEIDGVSSTQLTVLHISEADYHQLVKNDQVDPKTIYIVSADGYMNMYDYRVTNLSTVSSEPLDAANVSFVTAYVGDQIATVNTDIDSVRNALSAVQDDLSSMISAIQLSSARGEFISAVVEGHVASFNALSVSDLVWDVDVINGGDSGYTQT